MMSPGDIAFPSEIDASLFGFWRLFGMVPAEEAGQTAGSLAPRLLGRGE